MPLSNAPNSGLVSLLPVELEWVRGANFALFSLKKEGCKGDSPNFISAMLYEDTTNWPSVWSFRGTIGVHYNLHEDGSIIILLRELFACKHEIWPKFWDSSIHWRSQRHQVMSRSIPCANVGKSHMHCAHNDRLYLVCSHLHAVRGATWIAVNCWMHRQVGPATETVAGAMKASLVWRWVIPIRNYADP